MSSLLLSVGLLSGALLAAQVRLLPGSATQTPVPSYTSKGNLSDPALSHALELLEQGKLGDAEAAVRRYLQDHGNSADAHYLLGYVFFKENDPKSSLAEYAEGAHYRSPGALELEVIGCDYFLMEDYAAADTWLTRSIQRDPKNALALYILGRTRYNEKRFPEAVDLFTQCLKLDPINAKAQENLGLTYQRLGKNEDAERAYRAALALGTDIVHRDPGPYLKLGTLLADNNRPGEAVSYLAQAVQLASNDPAAHRELGRALLLSGQLEPAQAELERAEKLDPQSGPTHFLLAQVYRKQGLSDRARTENELYAALTGSHSSPDDPLQEARALLDLGKLSDAELVIRRYLELHKNSADAHYLLGYILFKQQNPKPSLAEYTEGAKYRKPSAHDLEVVASDYVLLKDYADADKWFTKSIEWEPANVLALYYLGRTKYNENRFEEAINIFNECLKLDPKNVKAEDNLGLSYEALGRTEEAMAAFRRAIAWENGATSKDPGPYVDLGSTLVDIDRSKEAVPYLLEALQISPQDLRAHRALGKAYLHLNDLDKAQSELEETVQLAPQSAPAHFMLAQVYRKRGLFDKARSETERYAALAGSRSTPESE